MDIDISIADSLNNWADAAGKYVTGIHFGDTLSLTDVLAPQLLLARSVGDSLSFADDISLTFHRRYSFADSINNWADSVQLQMHIRKLVVDDLNNWSDIYEDNGLSMILSRSAADSLNNWADDVVAQLNTAELVYLREYLNDVVN